MSSYLITALVCATVGTLPLLLAGMYSVAIAEAVVLTPILWGFFYCAIPTTIWPMFGMPGFVVFVLWALGFGSNDCLR